MASSTMWILYSYINSVMQRKYNSKLQDFPRLKLLLKSFDKDVKKKAAIFKEVKLKGFMQARNLNAYWLVAGYMYYCLFRRTAPARVSQPRTGENAEDEGQLHHQPYMCEAEEKR